MGSRTSQVRRHSGAASRLASIAIGSALGEEERDTQPPGILAGLHGTALAIQVSKPERRKSGMRKRRPHVALMQEVTIKRSGEQAIIEYKDTEISTVHLRIGPEIEHMTDEEILALHNNVIQVQQQMAAEDDYVAVEVPAGSPQIYFNKECDQWIPRGSVVRCEINDGGPDCETTVIVDDRELSLIEFGNLLKSYNGWGMRIIFVPDDEIHKKAEIEVREPDKPKG